MNWLTWLHRIWARWIPEPAPTPADKPEHKPEADELPPELVAFLRPTRLPEPRPTLQVVTGNPLVEHQALVRFDPSRAYEELEQGVRVQRATIEVLLADGQTTRLGVLAYYEPEDGYSEPARLSYLPIHEVVEREVSA